MFEEAAYPARGKLELVTRSVIHLAGRGSILVSPRCAADGWGGRNGCRAAFVPTVFLFGSKFLTVLFSPFTPTYHLAFLQHLFPHHNHCGCKPSLLLRGNNNNKFFFLIESKLPHQAPSPHQSLQCPVAAMESPTAVLWEQGKKLQ